MELTIIVFAYYLTSFLFAGALITRLGMEAGIDASNQASLDLIGGPDILIRDGLLRICGAVIAAPLIAGQVLCIYGPWFALCDLRERQA